MKVYIAYRAKKRLFTLCLRARGLPERSQKERSAFCVSLDCLTQFNQHAKTLVSLPSVENFLLGFHIIENLRVC